MVNEEKSYINFVFVSASVGIASPVGFVAIFDHCPVYMLAPSVIIVNGSSEEGSVRPLLAISASFTYFVVW